MIESFVAAEIDRLITKIKIEDELAEASEKMEIMEIFDHAESQGTQYALGYKEGWRDSSHLHAIHRLRRMQSVSEKKEALAKRLALAWHRFSTSDKNEIRTNNRETDTI